MAAKIIAKLVLVGTQIVGRAFMDAYRQAAANGAKQAASGSRAGATSNTAGTPSSAAVNEFTRKTGISLEEAAQILNVDRDATLDQVRKNFDHLHKVNDKTSGGSFYLQSKVYRAKERMEMELQLNATQPPAADNNKPNKPENIK